MKVRWEEMLPDELLEAIRERQVCFMPYGLAEPHGAYSALGLDWLKAEGLCRRAAEAHSGVVAPPFCWHVAERDTFDFPRENGVKQSLCSGLPPELFYQTVLQQLRSFDARGFRAAILVTGHYGGVELDMRLVCDYYRRRSGTPMEIRCLADHQLIDYGGYKGDHAGYCETQQLMAIRPDLVEPERKEPSPESGPWIGIDFESKGRAPSQEEGEKIVASQIESLGRIRHELLDAYSPREGYAVPSQDKVTEWWTRFHQLTQKYWVASRTWKEYTEKNFLTFPGWGELGL
ncbi:MAG: creatininase family protein [Planctomycetota bacterium]|jgi:creatinine amidohydrolase/Fe(II)-dependent formamide hydrolase-like protein